MEANTSTARLLCLATILSGCGGATALSAGAENVEWLSERPEGDLESLGDVQCQRGSNWVGPATNVSACRNAIRNQAHEMGADLVVITSEQIGTGDCANCVVFFGTAYRRRSGASAARTYQPTTPVTAGGSNPSPLETLVRNGLDQRRDVILQCTEQQAVTIVTAYAATGELSFSLAGPSAGTPAEECIRSTLGHPTIDTGGQAGAVMHVIEPAGW